MKEETPQRGFAVLPVAATVRGAVIGGALAELDPHHVHTFGMVKPGRELEHLDAQVDPVREANLVLPRKDARREILAAYVAQRDTVLKACIEDVLGEELTDPAAQLEGHELLELPSPAMPIPGLVLPPAQWVLDGQPLLLATPLYIREQGDESRGEWRRFELLRNVADEWLLDVPETIYRRTVPT